MRIMNKAIDWVEDYLILALMVVMPIVIFVQIVLRVTGGSLKWTEETARYLYIWVIYLGCSRGVRLHSELSVDAIRNVLKDGSRARAVYDLATTLLCAAFAAVFVRYSIAMIENLVKRPQYSAACHYNMILVYLSSVLASVLMLIRYLQNIYRGILAVLHPQPAVEEGRGGDAA